jgi:magnesium transporter
MLGKILHPEIEQLIRQRRFAELRNTLTELHPLDLADILQQVPSKEKAIVFRLLPKSLAADAIECMPSVEQRRLIRSLGQKEVAEALNEMTPDDRTALLEDLPEPVAEQILKILSPAEYCIAAQLLAYPPESVGRRMTTRFASIRPTWTVARSLQHLRAIGKSVDALDCLYVIDDSGKLLDDIPLRDLIIADAHKTVADLMDHQFVSLSAKNDQETTLRVFQQSGLTALPVIDEKGFLVGIVTADAALKIAQTESTEDIAKIGGSEDLGGPYLQVGLMHMVKRRATWLCALFLGEMLTATVMGYYEHEIARAVVLALFIPLVISSGGNSGSQATTLIIRAMALGHLTLKDWFRVMQRELVAGLLLGSILGSIAFVRIALWPSRLKVYGEHYLLIALTVGTALVGVVMFGTLMGSLLPFVLRRLGFDPAVSSAPFVATLVDVTGLIIYFSVAWVVLRGVLL